MKCQLDEYDCGDVNCDTHHFDCDQDLGPECWHDQESIEARKSLKKLRKWEGWLYAFFRILAFFLLLVTVWIPDANATSTDSAIINSMCLFYAVYIGYKWGSTK